MTDQTFTQLDELNRSRGAAAAIDRLIETLRAEKDFHRLFDALLLKTKFDMGLPLVRPTSFDDVPEDRRREFEEAYINAAREVGEAFLAEKRIPHAWVYLRTIREPEKVAQVLEELEIGPDVDEETEQIINIALFEGANPVKGVQWLLQTHGTCNTITALDQQFPALAPEDRARAAALMVDNLYEDLRESLRHEAGGKLHNIPPGETVRELITGRDWLFEGDNFHIDVSHLNSVVRFARLLEPESPHLQRAVELAEYGSRLAEQFQYPGDPPFEDFYPAHIRYLKALAGEGRDEAVAYFRERLQAADDDTDRMMAAYVLVDLLGRLGRMDEALELGTRYLKDVDESSGFSLAKLCQEAGRLDALREVAREKGDLVAYTAALLQDRNEPVTT